MKKNGIKQPISEAAREGLTEFIRECIMIIDREKENGTLTDTAGREMIELLGITCVYLSKNEPELKKEGHGIMGPIVMTQAERVEYEREKFESAMRKLIENYCYSGRNRQEAQEDIQDIFSLDEAEEKMEKYWVQADK